MVYCCQNNLFVGIKGHLLVCNSWGTCPGGCCNTDPTNGSVKCYLETGARRT